MDSTDAPLRSLGVPPGNVAWQRHSSEIEAELRAVVYASDPPEACLGVALNGRSQRGEACPSLLLRIGPGDGRQRAADVAVVDMDMVQAGAQLAPCYSYAQNEPDVCVLASLAQHVYTHQGTGP